MLAVALAVLLALAASMTGKVGIDRLCALLSAIESVRRGGTLSIVGV